MSKIMNIIKKIMITTLSVSIAYSSVNAKTLRVAYDADPVSMDPHEQISGGTLQNAHLLFDPLVRWNKDKALDGRLATSWKRINEKTMRFTLRKGVKFHSGNDFTAKDVKYTVERLKSSPDFKVIFDAVSSVKIIDDYTVEINTKFPYPLLLNTATSIFPMDSKFYAGRDEIKKGANSFASTNVSGTGPFVVAERQQGVKLVYTAFKGYWDKNRGNVDKIVLTPISENSTRTAALLSGEVDFISPVSPTDFKLIKSSRKVNLITLSGTRIIMLHMNQNRNQHLKDVRVRQAIVHAVNNVGIAKKIMNGFATPAGQMSPKGYQGYNKDLIPRYDLKKAKALMKEAGVENGFKITMMTPNNRYVNDAKIAQAVSAMLAKIKIKVDLKTMPKAQYWPLYDQRAADIMMLGGISDTSDSANFNEFLTMCQNKESGKGAYNASAYCNKEVDALTIAANKETNITKRKAMLQKAEAIMYKEAAFIPLHWQNQAWGQKNGVDAEGIVDSFNTPFFGNLVIKK